MTLAYALMQSILPHAHYISFSISRNAGDYPPPTQKKRENRSISKITIERLLGKAALIKKMIKK